MDWMKIAWAQVGVHETPGPAATAEIVAFFRDAGFPQVVSDETAWCAAFVGACLERAGIRCTHSLMARSYEAFGTAVEDPRIGAIAVFRRTSDPAFGHVGFVAGWTDTSILVLGGNQADAVNTKHFPRADLVALRWPGGAVSPAQLAKRGSRIVKGANENKADGAKASGSIAGAEMIPEPPAGGLEWLQKIGSQLDGLQGVFGTIEQFLLFAMGKGKTIALLLAAFYLGRIIWRSGWIATWRAEDASTGKTVQQAEGTAT